MNQLDQLEVTECPGCGESLYGSTMCAECVRLDVIYEARWHRAVYSPKLNTLTTAMVREDVGVAEYVQPPSQSRAWMWRLLAMLAWPFVYWYLGKFVIALLCGAR